MPTYIPEDYHGHGSQQDAVSEYTSQGSVHAEPASKNIDSKKDAAPFWLKQRALVFFFVVFIACIAALFTLDRVIKSRNGLALTISSSSYSWTYGPTAFFIFILSLWRRVDYYYKLREPWRELLAEPSLAERSIMLDYITPFQVMTFTHALERRHFSVAASVAGFFLLKFIILMSTTLFVMRETEIRAALDVTFEDVFDASKVWQTYYSLGGTEFPSLGGGPPSSIWKYLANLNNVTDTETDWKPPDHMVTQSFMVSSYGFNVTRLEAPVDIFLPRITCEDAMLSTTSNELYFNSSFQTYYQLTSETCSNIRVGVNPCLGDRFGDEKFSKDQSYPCQPRPRVYSVHRVNCHGNQDTRYAITTADFESDVKYFEGSNKTAQIRSLKLTRSSAIMCKINYSIETAYATLEPTSGLVTIANNALYKDTKPIQNLSSNDLAEMLWRDLQTSGLILVVDDKLPTIRPILGEAHPGPEAALFQLMYAQMGQPANLEAFYNTLHLKNASISVLEGVTLEFARQSLLVTRLSGRVVEGWVAVNRLHIRHIAFCAMVAILSLLVLLCAFLLFTFNPFPWKDTFSGSIAGIGAILANSSEMQGILVDSGYIVRKELKNRLCNAYYFAAINSLGEVEVRVDKSPCTPSEPAQYRSKKSKHIWVPVTARLPLLIVTFAMPVLCIGLLELLYRILRLENHLVPIRSKDSVTLSYIIQLASTLTVFGVASLINNLDFTIVMFAPYSVLRSGSARADRSILFHLLSVNPFLVLFKSIQQHQFGAAASNTATLIAGFLTIIVSGLWVSMDSAVNHQTSRATINNWDRTWFSNTSTDGGASVALNLIRFDMAKTPPEMWNDYVLPKINLTPADIALAESTYLDSNYTYNLLALQPFLNCSVLPQSAISNTNMIYQVSNSRTGYHGSANGTSITVQPQGIDPRCSNAIESRFANLTFGMDFPTISSVRVGRYFDIPQSTAGQISTDCPSIGIIFGSVTGNSAAERNLTALICSQGIYQVPLKVEYTGNPALQVIKSVQLQGQPRNVENATSGARTMGYQLNRFMESGLNPIVTNSAEYQYDSFFTHLILRNLHEELAGTKNIEKLIKAITQDYNEYARHVVNFNLRAGDRTSQDSILSAVGDNSTQPSSFVSDISGSYSASITHLVIDRTSKIVLQVLFATMTSLSLTGFLLVKIRGTLPRDPCSIGSTMAFLADSQLCDKKSGVLPEGVTKMSERELKAALSGWVFSLGWWETESSAAESIVEETNSSSGTKKGDNVTELELEGKRFGVDVGKAGM